MEEHLKGNHGSTDAPTGYEGQEKPNSRTGFGYSAWALGLAAAFLATVCIWTMLETGDSIDPAPEGSAGSGIVQERVPAIVNE